MAPEAENRKFWGREIKLTSRNPQIKEISDLEVYLSSNKMYT